MHTVPAAGVSSVGMNCCSHDHKKNGPTPSDFQDKIPKWSCGDEKIKQHYYKVHQETWLDRILGWIACKMGIIVHGDLDQNQLQAKMAKFDVHKILKEGKPYENSVLSHAAQQLIIDSLQKFDGVIDTHLHNLGYDEGNYLNPSISARGIASWMDYFKFLVIRYACGISSPEGSTQEARRRIHLYAKHFPKLQGILLPIHKAVQKDGQADWDKTGNYLTNRSALETAQSFQGESSKLYSAVSVHPNDPKWKEKLTKAHDLGIRLVKWMPPQSIQPDLASMEDFYKEMAALGMVLIAHAGPEHALPVSEEWQDWGNPLRFRRALELGVNVILAHCGHKDLIPDLDDENKKNIPGYELFIRVAKEAEAKGWAGKVYGDLAAVSTHYGPDFVRKLLEYSRDAGVRYLYGSDYPFTNLIKPGNDPYPLMAKAGLLDPGLVKPLGEIRQWNPLLANFVFTYNLRIKSEDGQEDIHFPDTTFSGHFKDAPIDHILLNQ